MSMTNDIPTYVVYTPQGFLTYNDEKRCEAFTTEINDAATWQILDLAKRIRYGYQGLIVRVQDLKLLHLPTDTFVQQLASGAQDCTNNRDPRGIYLTTGSIRVRIALTIRPCHWGYS